MRIAILAIASLLSTAAIAQTPTPPPPNLPAQATELTPKTTTDGQKLALMTLKAAMADKEKLETESRAIQQQAQQAQQSLRPEYDKAMKDVTESLADIKKDNGWGDDVQYDQQQHKWFRTPPPPPAAKPATPAPAPTPAAAPAAPTK